MTSSESLRKTSEPQDDEETFSEDEAMTIFAQCLSASSGCTGRAPGGL